MQVLSSLSGLTIYAPSAGFAPTNSADVSAIASAYQVVSATATQLNAGTAYLTSVNETPISASRAGNAANASLATSAWYDGTGRVISSLPDEATVSSIASTYSESAASGKLDSSAVGTYDYYGTSLVTALSGSGFYAERALRAATDVLDRPLTTLAAESSLSSKQDASAMTSYALSADVSGVIDTVSANSATWGQGGVDSATVSAIASAYVESGVSGKLDASAVRTEEWMAVQMVTSISGFQISAVTAAAATYADSAYGWYGASSKLDESATADFYPTSNPSAFVDSAYVDSAVSGKQDSLTFAYNEDSAISSINGSALAGQDGEVVTATATRIWENGGITATALSSVNDTPIASQYLLTDTKWASEPSVAGRSYHQMNVNPLESPFTATSDIYSPLRYATGAVLTYLSMASNDTTSGALGGRQTFGGFFKGNEIYISNGQSSVQQCLRMETHASRGVNVFGTDAFHSSYFKLSTAGVGISSTAGTATFDLEHYNSWNAKLDASAIECDTASAITAIGGSSVGGGVDSATVSAIASAYAESAASSKMDSSAMTAYVEKTAYDNLYSAFTALNDIVSTYSGYFSSISAKVDNSAIGVIE